MDESNSNYLSLVRKEFGNLSVRNSDIVSFCKVGKPITKENFTSEFQKYFIPDQDAPEIASNTAWIPLSVTDYPSVLKSTTANQAGYWAIQKCKKEGWNITLDNIECCLTNLEMDM